MNSNIEPFNWLADVSWSTYLKADTTNEKRVYIRDKPEYYFTLSESIENLNFENVYKIQSILGSGGCKKAYTIKAVNPKSSENIPELLPFALIAPNTDSPKIGLQTWEDIVDKEVAFANKVKKMGFLCSENEKIVVTRINGTPFQAYFAPSFPSLKEKGIYIIDIKNSYSSTWPSEKSIFSFKPAPDDLAAWDPVVIPLIKDLVKFKNFFSSGGDTCNIALKESENGKPFETRLFLFDFQALQEEDVSHPVSKEEYQALKIKRASEYSFWLMAFAFNGSMGPVNNYRYQLDSKLSLLYDNEHPRNNMNYSEYLTSVNKFVDNMIQRHFELILWKALKNFAKPGQGINASC